MSEGSVFRDYRGTKGVIEDADPPASTERRLPRGRVGVSRVKSPRTGVRDPGPAHVGSEGEPAYGAPMDTPKPQPPRKRPNVKKDPLKKKD